MNNPGRKTPNPIDVEVGSKIRLRRLLVGMSQQELAAQLGVTFQQVQKYEKGTNRVSASRLQQIATIFRVPPSFFFGEVMAGAAPEPGGDAAEELSVFISSREGHELNVAFTRLSPRLRRNIVRLVNTLANGEWAGG
ncbi:helix-turn-helix domain-containing protein [Shinella sp. DD12]|uniref:helix-turn-helix domain-containing protein n=1 Tax=Shinella sp. DD12 TaxID=1410620 RepID=UPI000437B061|nr:helix-turn-helix transcriptional regulator [Shinella sp. DD12]EYR84213.1 putative transcriptional regulator [Shinella sp. DD12]